MKEVSTEIAPADCLLFPGVGADEHGGRPKCRKLL